MNQPKEVQVRARVDDRDEKPPGSAHHRSSLVLALVVSFLNEAKFLPLLLESIEDQTRRPDQLILVDDGSTDGSYEMARAFAAAHSYARAVKRPARPPEADRLATAAELQAFHWGLEQVTKPFDVVAKLDADLTLGPFHVAEMETLFQRDSGLGLAGGYLSIRAANGTLVREQHPSDHVRGPNKFYRRQCLDQISPLPAHLGWDTIDEVKARMLGWRTQSVEVPGGDSIHLRPTGMHDGRLRAFWRWGECAYGFGTHPVHVLAGGVARFRKRPYIVSGAAYIFGWGSSYLRRRPRAEPEIRAFRRREEWARLQRVSRRLGRGPRRPRPVRGADDGAI